MIRVARKQKKLLARATSRSLDIPAPISGLNTRDSLAAMSPTDAIELINYIPQQSGLVSRRGYTEKTTAYPSYVETIIPYINGLTEVLITASDDKLYTDTGASKTQIGTGFLNARWEAVKLGANMILVNGEDDPRNFDGTTLTTPSLTGNIATFGTDKINIIHKHRNRVYMASTQSGSFFYGGVNSVSGAFTEFQLDRVSDTSGNIISIKTISQDAGNGPDDYIAFMLATGEVIIYQGSDPGDADNWALVGKYKMPPLINQRCAVEFAGDVLCLTKQDLIKLSDVIRYTGETGGFNIQPSKLSGFITQDYNAYKANWGFSLTTYPKGGWIIINVPQITNQRYNQYVVNAVTGAATEFNGWTASCFGVLGDNLYFGGNTYLYLGDDGLTDDGADINLFAKQAFTNLTIPNKKKISNVRIYIGSDGSLSAGLSIALDFGFGSPQGVSQSTVSGAEWDFATWDVDDWAGIQARTISFVTSGIGVFVSPTLNISINNQQINWYATTYNFDIAEAY
jgi:hypothetical protein